MRGASKALPAFRPPRSIRSVFAIRTRERRLLRHGHDPVRQLRVAGQGDFEPDLGCLGHSALRSLSVLSVHVDEISDGDGLDQWIESIKGGLEWAVRAILSISIRIDGLFRIEPNRIESIGVRGQTSLSVSGTHLEHRRSR